MPFVEQEDDAYNYIDSFYSLAVMAGDISSNLSARLVCFLDLQRHVWRVGEDDMSKNLFETGCLLSMDIRRDFYMCVDFALFVVKILARR